MTLNELLPKLEGVKKTGTGYVARCPAHDDKSPSLSLTEGKGGRILTNCKVGCTFAEIAGALGLKPADFFTDKPERRNGSPGNPRIVATYDYQDEAGALVYQYCRWEPGFDGEKKSMRARRPDPDKPGKWINNLRGVRRVLYRLPQILAAKAKGETLFLVDGEKDADALAERGFAGTCNPCGGGNWSDDYTVTLAGAQVVIIPDKDKPKKRRDGSEFIPGKEHAAKKAVALVGKAASVKVLELPDVNSKPVKDAHDYFAAGGTPDDLRKLVATAKLVTAADAAPAPPPALAITAASAPPPAGMNAAGFVQVDDETRLRAVPLFYFREKGQWFGPRQPEGFGRMKDASVSAYLAEHGFNRLGKGATGNSVCERAELWLSQHKTVDYAGPLAGFPAGFHPMGGRPVLVTESLRVIQPKAGKFPKISLLIETLFADDEHPQQADVLLTWLAASFAEFYRRMTKPGPHPFRFCPALGIYGPRLCGKSALLQLVLVPMLGGREANPFQYLRERKFNKDLLPAAVLVLDDTGGRLSLQDRHAFGESIKDTIWKAKQRIEGKGLDAIQVELFWRMVLAGNDDTSGLQTAPALSPGMDDKIIFLRARQAGGLPGTHEEQDTWAEAIAGELPAFADFLLHYTPPASLELDPRSRVAVFRHPALISDLREMQPELKLMEIVDMSGLISDEPPRRWKGTATEFERDLREKDKSGMAERLLQGSQNAGRLLSEISRICPERVQRGNTGGTSHYTILPSLRPAMN